MKKKISMTLVIVMIFGIFMTSFPDLKLPAFAVGGQYTFDYSKDSRVIVIDEQTVSEKQTNNFIIPNGAFSVTVSGNVSVTLIFGAVDANGDGAYDGVLINRGRDYDNGIPSEYAKELQNAGRRLGWSNEYVPTCPLLLTKGAKVHASFAGECDLFAGVNGWTSDGYSVTNNRNPKPWWGEGTHRGGYAGIQVEQGASLTIDATIDSNKNDGTVVKGLLKAYGGHQFFIQKGYTEAVDFNPILAPGGMDKYARPKDTIEGKNGGGAGIGGGVAYNTEKIADIDATKAGTPGEIIINNGNIIAVGGHQAAGIGGGVNGASTSSQIVINGGDVTAVGGRWASGIGDGDSDTNNPTKAFENPHKIIINDGKINASGGVAASGIGATDQVSTSMQTGADGKLQRLPDSSIVHGLSIIIAGGEVVAHSGEANTDNPKDTNIATAAIGSGQNSNLKENSITIYAFAKIKAVSFSQYAISNNGIDASKIPSVNIDPDGYMYLARFIDDKVFTPDNKRVFSCYTVKADKLDNPMLVEAPSSELLNKSFSTTYNKNYYAKNKDNGKFYLVTKDGSIAQAPTGVEGESDAKGRFYPKVIPNLSYYFDVNSPIATHTVPAKYKAIAMTLPDPTTVGNSGTYILHVPDAGMTPTIDDDIYAVITKPTPGTTSGEIVPNQDSTIKHHIQEGTNGNQDQFPNIKEDDVAMPLKDINIFETETSSENLLDKYNQQFYPSVYGYDIYLPRKSTSFVIDFSYDDNGIEEISIVTNSKLTPLGDTKINGKLLTGGTKTNVGGVSTVTHKLKIDINNEEYSELWIQKTDKKSNGNHTLVYKISINKKPLYTVSFDDLNKEYDGIAKEGNVNALFLKGKGFSAPQEKYLGKKESAVTNPAYSMDPNTVQIPDYTGDFVNRINNSTETITISNKLVMNQPLNGTGKFVTTFKFGSNISTIETTIDFINQKMGPITQTGPQATNKFKITHSISNNENGVDVSLVSKRNSIYTYNVLSLAFKTPSKVENPIPGNPLETETARVVEAMKQNMTLQKLTNASTVVSATTFKVNENYPLNIITRDSGEKNLTNQNSTFSVNAKEIVESKQITLTCQFDEDHTEALKLLPPGSIVYKYYKDPVFDTNGKVTSPEFTGIPKDAGKYAVTATIISQDFEAYGAYSFEITKRMIKATSIMNWRRYLENSELESLNKTPRINITNYGEIFFDKVVEGEKIKITSSVADFCYYYEDGTGLSISFSDSKIKLEKINIVQDEIGKNYYFIPSMKDGDGFTFSVPGELAYKMDEAIFRRESTDTAVWDKYWPTSEKTPLDFVNDDHRVDYHSPSSDKHREYVYLYTVNEGNSTSKYSVDIEFGTMSFTYSKTIWNVNTHQYDETIGGYWSGNDGKTNIVSILNRSNRSVFYTAEVTLNQYYGRGCKASLQTNSFEKAEGTPDVHKLTSQEVGPAIPSTVVDGVVKDGSATKESFYLCMYGVPQISSQEGGTSTGMLIITLSMNGN